MRYDRLFTKLYCEPLLLKTSAWRGFERALIALADSPSAGKLRQSEKADRTANILEYSSASTALIHIDGAIDKHISAMEMDCYGGYDLRDLDNALAQVGSDSSISNVMLVVNSPGGSVTGVPESAAKIASLSTRKNVFAFTDGMMCSAAYYLASQADQIFGTPSSDIGSIGVYCALLDLTRQLEAEGVGINFIADGKYKGMGAPFKPLSADERAMFQAEVNKVGAMFRAAVTSKRPDVADEVMQGQSFFGDDALSAGLCDAIVSDLSEALAQF